MDAFKGLGAALDMPPVPAELLEGASVASNGNSTASTSTPAPAESPAGEEGEGASAAVAPGADDAALDDTAAEGQFLYNNLSRRLLERMLTALHVAHREELLKAKREHTIELRSVVQHLCQIEPTAVTRAVERDIKEYEAQ